MPDRPGPAGCARREQPLLQNRSLTPLAQHDYAMGLCDDEARRFTRSVRQDAPRCINAGFCNGLDSVPKLGLG